MEASQDKITFELLFYILSNHTKDLNITESEFALLKSIVPKCTILPISEDSCAEFINIVGDTVRKKGGGVKLRQVFTSLLIKLMGIVTLVLRYS